VANVFYSRTDHVDFAALHAEWHASLSGEETYQLAKLRLERDQRDYLCAHVLLRHALREAWGTSLAAPPPVSRQGWSLTHAAGFVACAIADDPTGAVGIDSEPLAASERLESIADTFLTTAELALMPSDPNGRARRMVEIWTAKEAVLKALGEGFGSADGFSVLTMLESTPLERVDDWGTISVRDARNDAAFGARVRWVDGFALAVAVIEGNEGIPRLTGVTL
jgi:phosphopantetheinyl transferase